MIDFGMGREGPWLEFGLKIKEEDGSSSRDSN